MRDYVYISDIQNFKSEPYFMVDLDGWTMLWYSISIIFNEKDAQLKYDYVKD